MVNSPSEVLNSTVGDMKGSRVAVSIASGGHALVSSQILAGAYGTQTVLRKQRANGRTLSGAVLDREPSAWTQVLAGARQDLLDGLETGSAR